MNFSTSVICVEEFALNSSTKLCAVFSAACGCGFSCCALTSGVLAVVESGSCWLPQPQAVARRSVAAVMAMIFLRIDEKPFFDSRCVEHGLVVREHLRCHVQFIGYRP